MSLCPSVIAVVLNYDLPDVTRDCVATLAASTYGNLRVVVVDNGSPADGVARLRDALSATAELLTVSENRYYAGGMNVGLRHALAAGCDYALAMNNDTIVDPQMVERLVQAAVALPDAGILAPRIDAGASIWSLGARRRRNWPFPQELARDTDAVRQSQPFRVDYVTGCAMMLSRALLERAGMFDEHYVLYYEDADLCERARGAGLGVYVVPQARMNHLVGSTARRQSTHAAYLHTVQRVRFYRQHHQPLWALGHVLIAGQEAGRALADLSRGHRDVARARLRGLREGWRPTPLG